MRPRTERSLVAANLDVPRLVERLADIEPRGQGRDLASLLQDARAPWREDVVLQGYGELTRPEAHAGWATIRGDRYKYIEFDDGRRELYDLEKDPLEVTNRVGEAALEPRVRAMTTALRARMGLTIAGDVPPAVLGRPYTTQLEAKGGTAPLRWELDSGQLPPGLFIDAAGRVTGTPIEAGSWTARIRVTGARTTRQGERRESVLRSFNVVVVGAA